MPEQAEKQHRCLFQRLELEIVSNGMEEPDGGKHWNAPCVIEGTFKVEHEVAAHLQDALHCCRASHCH